MELVANLFSDVKVKSSECFVKRVSPDGLRDDSHRLVTWDYDSMFTNVPFGFAKKIILDYYHVIAEETAVPSNLFLEALF